MISFRLLCSERVRFPKLKLVGGVARPTLLGFFPSIESLRPVDEPMSEEEEATSCCDDDERAWWKISSS